MSSNDRINLDFFYDIIIGGEKIEISEEDLTDVDASFRFLTDFAKHKIIYGINTGFGPMAQYKVEEEDQVALQYNLIRSHASGCGNPISESDIKAAMICRLQNIMKGYSGIHPSIPLLLKDFINNDIYPVLYEHGGVGASGDLVQLSHMALSLIGEGEVFYKGEIRPTGEVMKLHNLEPIQIHLREGLSLINGTSVMSGIGAVNLLKAKNLFNWTLVSAAIINEIVSSYDDSFSEFLNGVKMHEGQNYVALKMRELLLGSKMIKDRHKYLYNGVKDKIFGKKVQEFYSLRCIPQILGPIYDTINYTEKVVIDEVNSVNDNPIIDYKNENVYHGGNFHGDYISLEMDKLKIASTKMSMLTERHVNFMMNPKLNEIFPPFVNLGTYGLNLGMQGVQFTATSTTAENQTYSFPNYVHSIPNNNDNQDIVSMGTNSALIARKVIDNSYQVLAVQFMTLLQAIDFSKCSKDMAPFTKKIYEDIREIFPVFVGDSVKYKDVANVRDYLMNTKVEI
jgi:histidine ammonia-lyase